MAKLRRGHDWPVNKNSEERTMIQYHKFPDGGFVLHKIKTVSAHLVNATVSAWFDCDGKLLDAEFHYRNGRTRAVTGADTKSFLAVIGRRYATLEAIHSQHTL